MVEEVEDVARVTSLPRGGRQHELRIHVGFHRPLLRNYATARRRQAHCCAHSSHEACEGDVWRADHTPRNRIARNTPFDVREDAGAQLCGLLHGVAPWVNEHNRGAEKHEGRWNDCEEQYKPGAYTLVLRVRLGPVPDGGHRHKRDHLSE